MTSAQQLAATPQMTAANMRRVVWSSVVGTSMEWYDFIIYAVATALVFNKMFFPTMDPAIATIAAFSTYAVGFFARPLGAAIFGHYGDKLGRKAMLSTTILIMGGGTFLIGCLPTYEQIGVAAPILLVVLRFIQGVGIGGEWGGAVLMVVENAPSTKRGFFGSLVQVGMPVGNLAAIGIFALLSSLLSEDDFLSWGWRVPFLLSIVLIAVGLFIRIQLEESPAFKQLQAKQDVSRVPALEIFTHHRRTFFIAVGLKTAEIAYASIASVFLISYASGHLGLPRSAVLNATAVATAIGLVALPLFGWLSDKWGRKTLFYLSCLFCMGFAFPLFALIETRDPTIFMITIVVALCFGWLVMFAVGAAFYAELFTARLRYSGASLGFQIGAAITGGLTPLIAASLLVWSGGETWPISIYLIGCGAITAISTFMAPETSRKEMTS